MILGAGAVSAVAWFLLMEVYRGLPATSGNTSFILKFVNPIVAILICIAALLIYLKTH